MSAIPDARSNFSATVNSLMFDYGSFDDEELRRLSAPLPMKLLRWIAIHHPDNRTRKEFFRMTNVKIGTGTVLNAGLMLVDEYKGLVSFGERVAVAQNVSMVASSNPNNSRLAGIPYVQEHLIHSAPIHIGDDAWIGAHAVILPGVQVGAHAIVGSGAVVIRDVKPFTVVAGVPAREIRVLTPATDTGSSAL
jgi:acetyltransferase-like isoleucine patch superfamily enzyme